MRYLRAGLVGAVRAATGETHVWLAPGYDSLTATWARHFEPLIEPAQGIPAALLSQLAYPVEQFQLAASQLARANAAADSDSLARRPTVPFQVAPGRDVWTAIGFETVTPPPPRFVALLAGAVGPSGPFLRVWRPGPPKRLPPDLVGASETSPGTLRIWFAGDSVVTLQARFAQAAGGVPRGVADVYLTLGTHRGQGSTRSDALRSLLTGESRTGPPLDTTLAGRWEQARRLIARADSAFAAGNIERFGQVWREIRRLLAPAPRPR